MTASSALGSWQGCIIFCVREEPVLFLRADEDFVPYTPRDKQNLHENLQGLGPEIQVESLELAIRKEVRVTDVGGGAPLCWQAAGSSSALTGPCPLTSLPGLGEQLAGRPARGKPEEGHFFFF